MLKKITHAFPIWSTTFHTLILRSHVNAPRKKFRKYLSPKIRSYSLSQDFHSLNFRIETFFNRETADKISPSLVWSSSDNVSPSEWTSRDFFWLVTSMLRSLSECSLPLAGGSAAFVGCFEVVGSLSATYRGPVKRKSDFQLTVCVGFWGHRN